MEILVVSPCQKRQLKSNIFCAILCMYKNLPIISLNNISFASELDDNIGAVPENSDSDASLSGKIAELAPEGSLNRGYASILFNFHLTGSVLANELKLQQVF